MGLVGEEYLRSRTPRLVRQGGVLRHEGLPRLLICLDQTLLRTLQDKPQAVRIVQASAAAQANAETLRDKLPHHFPPEPAEGSSWPFLCPTSRATPALPPSTPPVASRQVRGGTPGLLKYQGCRPSLAEGGGPSADGVSIPAQRLGGARGGQAPAQEPQCVPPFSLPG